MKFGNLYLNSPKPTPITTRLLPIIMLVALALRFGLFAYVLHIGPPRWITDDSFSYLQPAESIVKLGRFSQDIQHPNAPEVLRTPGYPLFLAALLALTGDMLRNTIIAQNILWVAVVLPLVWVIARNLWNIRAAFWSTLLLALDPSSILLGQVILTEMIFMIFLVPALFAAIRYAQTRHLYWIALHGLLLALAMLIRPVALYLVVVALLGIILTEFRHRSPHAWRRCLFAFVSFFVPWFLFIGGWYWRNYKAIGRFDMGPVTDINLIYVRSGGVLALSEGDSSIAGYRKVRERLKKKYPFYTAVDPDRRAVAWQDGPRYRAIAGKILREHPWQMVQMTVICTWRFFADTNREFLKNLLRSKPNANLDLPQLAAKFYIISIYILVLAAFYLKFRRRNWTQADYWLLATLLYLAMISATPDANARFRVPVMPILTLYSGFAISEIIRARNRNRSPAEALAKAGNRIDPPVTL